MDTVTSAQPVTAVTATNPQPQTCPKALRRRSSSPQGFWHRTTPRQLASTQIPPGRRSPHAARTPCYTVSALIDSRRAPRADDSQWIRVWPETASATYPTHRPLSKRWLLWLAGRSQDHASPCSSSAYCAPEGHLGDQNQAMLKQESTQPFACRLMCVCQPFALLHSFSSSPIAKENLVYPYS